MQGKAEGLDYVSVTTNVEGSPVKMPKRLVDVKQVSQMLCIKCSTIYKWVYEGRIPHYKIGKLIRFSEAEVWEWATGHKFRNQVGRIGRL